MDLQLSGQLALVSGTTGAAVRVDGGCTKSSV